MRYLLVAAAGACGAVVRFAIGLALAPSGFPWATLGINVAGSFLLGIVAAAGGRGWPPALTVAAGAGFLGAFTTFSTFSVETVLLLREGRAGTAATYVACSVLGGVLAAGLGDLAFTRSGP